MAFGILQTNISLFSIHYQSLRKSDLPKQSVPNDFDLIVEHAKIQFSASSFKCLS